MSIATFAICFPILLLSLLLALAGYLKSCDAIGKMMALNQRFLEISHTYIEESRSNAQGVRRAIAEGQRRGQREAPDNAPHAAGGP